MQVQVLHQSENRHKTGRSEYYIKFTKHDQQSAITGRPVRSDHIYTTHTNAMSVSAAQRSRYLRFIDNWDENTGFKGKQRDRNGSYLQLVDCPQALTSLVHRQSHADVPPSILSRLAHGLPARADAPTARTDVHTVSYDHFNG